MINQMAALLGAPPRPSDCAQATLVAGAFFAGAAGQTQGGWEARNAVNATAQRWDMEAACWNDRRARVIDSMVATIPLLKMRAAATQDLIGLLRVIKQRAESTPDKEYLQENGAWN